MGPDVILLDGPQSETGRRILFRPGVFRRSRRDPQFAPVDPIKAPYWRPVTNGVLAARVMVMLMLLVRNPIVIGDLVIRGWLYALAWASTIAMAFCIVGMIASLFLS